jgi:hypothetical protein
LLHETVDDYRHRLCRLHSIPIGIIAVTIMEEQYRTRTRATDRSFSDGLDAGAIRVPDAKGPPDSALTE